MFTLTLLGQVVVARHGKPISRFRSQAEIALLCYLAQTGQTHSREAVADRLWDASSTSQSLSNLRTVIARLRTHVREELLVTRKTIALRPESRQGVDSVRLQAGLRGVTTPTSRAGAMRLAATLRLYQGDFMAGFYLSNAPRFNEWVVVEQEHLRQQLFAGLQCLIAYAVEKPAPLLGIEAARQWISVDRFSERAHAHLIHLLALNNQRAAALRHYEQLIQLLEEELNLPPQPATLQLVERIREGKLVPRSSYTPALQRSRVPHNLPRELTPFVGRVQARAALVKRLLHPAYPLVTLTGEGGIGKTRLALAAARDIVASGSEHFPHGIGFVSLVELDGIGPVRDLMAAAIGEALNLSFSGEQRPADQLLTLLKSKRCLLLLDNFERLLDSEALDLIMALLQAGEGIHLLVTSRAPLDLNSEFVIRLAGLSIPDEDSPAERDLLAYDSLQLFAECAMRTGEVFHLAEHVAEVSAICRYLHGVPLAIKLAATWVGRLSPAAIVDAITSNPDFLATTRRDVPRQQRSMRAVFDYSWQLLSPRAQRALAHASIFRGGFDHAAAREVIGGAASESEQLVAHSLLELDTSGRYTLHELVREFAAEKLAQDGVTERVRARHGSYYLALLSELDHGGGQDEGRMRVVQANLDNVRRAWRWALAGPHLAAISSAWEGLSSFYMRYSLFQEGEEAFSAALKALDASARPSAKMGRIRACLQLARASHLNMLNRYTEAITLARAVCEVAGRQQDEGLLAQGRLQWGLACFRQGRFDEALIQLQAGLALARAARLAPIEATLHWRIGTTLLEKGEMVEARTALERALMIYRTLGSRADEGYILGALGWLEQRAMNFDAAQTHLVTALAIQRDLGVQHGVSTTLINLANVHELQGEFDEAYLLRLEALEILETIDDHYQRSLVTHGLGMQLSQLGDYEQAQHYYNHSIAIAQEVGDLAGVAWAQNNLGLLHNHLGDYERALTLHQEALRLAYESGSQTIEGLALSRIGQDLHGLGQFTEACGALQEALHIQQALQQRIWALESSAELAMSYLALGQTEQALALVEPLLPHLPTLSGAREPFRVYWNCYRVLAAQQDPRAHALLVASADKLWSQAARIQDPTLRHSFLQRVAVNRAILQALNGSA